MKKLKYLIVILVICILVFIGIEVFRKTENAENNEMNNMIGNTSVETGANTEDTRTENIVEDNTVGENATMQNNSESNSVEKLKNGEELMQKADKTLTARGWAGASNNVIGLKDGIVYYYNKASGEFYPIAEGIEDIYYATDYAEEITAKKDNEFQEIKSAPEFLIYE